MTFSWQYDNNETWWDRSSERKVLLCKKNIWDVDVDNTATSKLIKTKTNSQYFIGYLDKVIRQLVLILPKISGCVKPCKVKDGDKDMKNKLMSFPSRWWKTIREV